MYRTNFSVAGGIGVAVDGGEVVGFAAAGTIVDTRNVE